MNKLSKIISVIVLMFVVMSVSIVVHAYTNNDVIDYVTRAHTVNGRTMQLSTSQRKSLTQYLNTNPVTDAEANEIIAKLDQAENILNNSGATNLSDLSDSVKAEVMTLVKDAGKIAGLDVQIDTVNEVVTVKDMKGNVIISATSYSILNSNPTKQVSNGSSSGASSTSSNNASNGTKKLVYTGNDYTVLVNSFVAVIAVATAGIVIKKKNEK